MHNFHLPGRSPVFAANGMVATSHPLAAAAALDILKDGGNALDAAVAGAVLLGICEPQMTGLGGDCFALIKPAGTEDVIAVNGSGRAPKGLDADTLRAEGLERIDRHHAAAVTLPGAVDAFCRMSDRFGAMGLDRVLAPAIQYFEEGVPVAPRVAFDLAREDGASFNDAAKRHFLNGGRPFRLAERFAAPGQAEALRQIARNGRRAFYEGEVADDMLATLRAVGGTHDADDFASVEASFGTPCEGDYRGTTLLEHPPNGQGAIAILLAQMLAQFNLAGLDPNGAERLHLEIEATKLAYDARDRFLADAEHTARLDHLLDPRLAANLAALIDPKRAMADPKPLAEDHHRDTVLITAVDRDGVAVSLIYSIFASLGSGIATDRFGILFHNRGSGFNLIPGHPNEAGPGKRPMHTIIPAMTRVSGRIDMAFGVMGGQYQATGHSHVLSNMVDYGMDPQAAIDAPRVFPQPDGLWIEQNLPEATHAKLIELGHTPVRQALPIGGAQIIRLDHATGMLVSGSDPRKDGVALGY
ncbi:MAG: gamma-glutamyltransferase family protein [Pseudomonadota bacterium]